MNEIITKLNLFERAQPNFLYRVTADIVELKIIVKIEYVHTFKESDRHRRLEVRLRLLHKNPENRKERDFFSPLHHGQIVSRLCAYVCEPLIGAF